MSEMGPPLKTVFLVVLVAAVSGCAATGASRKGEEQIPGPAKALFLFYDKGLNHLSSVRSGTCPSYPSCSAYSREAFKKHGLVMGWLMTCDRLIRCGRDEMDISPKVLVNGSEKTYDPVSRNDFWWYDPPATSKNEHPPSNSE